MPGANGRLVIRGAVAVVACVALLGYLPATSWAVFPGRNGLIAYIDNDHDRDGMSSIVTIHSNGRGRRVIYRSSTGDDTGNGAFDPSWSPRGDQIAFDDYLAPPGGAAFGSQAIFVMQPNGSGVRRLTDSTLDAVEPAFSPGGTRIAFVAASMSLPYSPTELYIVPSSGGTPTQITHLTNVDNVRWLNSGRIAFTSVGSNYTIAADGTGLRRVPLRNASAPSWSASGRTIVFIRNGHVYTARGDGTHPHRLTNARGVDDHPAFSPDGKWVIFTRTIRTDSPAGYYPYLWLIDIHGRHAHRILAEPMGTAGAYDPSWQAVH